MFVAALAFAPFPAPAAPVRTGAADTEAHSNAVAEALEAVIPVERAINSYRMSHEGFPTSNAEAAVPTPAQFANNSVSRIDVGADGVIAVSLTAVSGVDGGVILFHPEYVPQSGGGDVHWTCASASYANIGDLTRGACAHTSQP
jgi:hypothetical protein